MVSIHATTAWLKSAARSHLSDSAQSKAGLWDDRSFSALQSNRRAIRRAASSDPGNTRAKALDVGTFPPRLRFAKADATGQNDPDYYRVTLTSSGKAKLLFQNLSNTAISGAIFDARGQIVYAEDGEALAGSIAAGRQIALVADAPKGVYYVRVTSSGQNNRYRFTADIS